MKKILFLSIVFISTAVFAQKVDYKALDKYISQTQKDWNIPGLSVGIVKDGKIVFENSLCYCQQYKSLYSCNYGATGRRGESELER